MQWSDKAEENRVPKETTFSGNLVKTWSMHVPEAGFVTTGGTGKNEIDRESRMSRYLLVAE
jgi:hypothetical protein